MDGTFIVVADNQAKFIGSLPECEKFEIEHPELATAYYKVTAVELSAGAVHSGIQVTLSATYSAFGN